MSTPNADILKELDTLQRRVDELRTLLRSEVMKDELPAGNFNTLVCRTDRETVGLVLRDVEEVLPMCWVTPVPDAPPWFPGLLNLGGEMVPVLDLSVRITGGAHEPALSDSIIICSIKNKRMGLIVREVIGVHETSQRAVQEVSERLVPSPYLLGVADFDGNPLMLLSISSLLSSSELPEGAL